MNGDTLAEDGWTLAAADDTDLCELMGWFREAQAVDRWSGPRFRFPFTHETFREDCRWDAIPTYSLKDPDGTMAAFGQYYDRYDRAHLARLITHPQMRRRGVGKRLVRMIMRAAQQQSGYAQWSLFVYRDNQPAYRCYLESGFVVQDYPDDAPLGDLCYFLTRKAILEPAGNNDAEAAPIEEKKK